MLKKMIVSAVTLLLLAIGLNSYAKLPRAVEGEALPSLAPMIDKVSPAVVNIATAATVQSPFRRDPFFGFYFQEQPKRVQNSLGSGVIVDASDGIILTNHHVIDGADEITIGLADGRSLQAKLIGSDESTDIAVLKIEADNLVAINVANSDELRVGDFVVALGNPFGLGQTVTSGIVSALGRSGLGIERFEDFIQTDAAINPGNSGGALVNLRGELIGINTAIVGPSGGNVGIGFAIPGNLANRLMQQIIQFGEVRRGILEGVNGDDLTDALARAFDVQIKRGVVVTHVDEDSPAYQKGLRRYDIITEVNGRVVRSMSELNNLLGILSVDNQVVLSIYRSGKQQKIQVPLSASKTDRFDGEKIHDLLSDVNLRQVYSKYDQPMGLIIADISKSSRAYQYGLREGDMIFGINQYRIRDEESAKEAADLTKRSLRLRVQRGYQELRVTLYR
jgi:Do/DeqQ family serine protease